MTVKEINKDRTPQLYYLKDKGVFVQGIRYPGNAASSGLDRRDIILTIDKEPVLTIEDVKRVYERIVKDDETREESGRPGPAQRTAQLDRAGLSSGL